MFELAPTASGLKENHLIPQEERKDYTLISNSQMRSYMSCRRKWYLEREGYTRDFKDFFIIGSLVHAGVAAYYEEATEAEIALAMGIEAEGSIKRHPGEEAKIEECLEKAEGYVGNYIKYAQEHDNFKVVAIEEKLTVLLNEEEKLGCTMIMDGLVEEDGKLWLMEHKTPAQVITEHLALDSQITLYIALIEKVIGRELEGVIYNMIRKKMPSEPKRLVRGGVSVAACDTTPEKYEAALIEQHGSVAASPEKNQKFYQQLLLAPPKFIIRERYTRTAAEKKEILERFEGACRELKEAKANQVGLYPNPTRENCSFCGFQDLCASCNNAEKLPSPDSRSKFLLTGMY